MTTEPPGADTSSVLSSPDWRPETVAVSAGRPPRIIDAPLNQPPVFASTYVGTHETGGPELGYGRDGNPTWAALETAIGLLEGGRALTYASGMAAVTAVLELVPVAGVVVVPSSCYLGVSAAVNGRAARYSWTVRTVDVADTDAVLEAAVGADLVWLESPTNPLIEVADLPTIGAALQGKTWLVLDNTFATPLRQQPLSCGFDVVVHSATKSLAGHSDVLLGAVVVAEDDPETYATLIDVRHDQGAVPGTMEAWLTLRGLRTLALRVRQAEENARELARRLADHPQVERVRYPGLPGDPGHARAAQVMSGFGSLLSVDLRDADTATRFIDGCRLWTHATSLGGVDSTFERRRRWAAELPSVPEGLVRMSVGIEHVEDLWSDLEHSLHLL